MKPFDFISIDFETATNNYNSACAIGIAAIKDLQIVDTYYSLIRPPDNVFDPRTIAIHGIHPSDVENAPHADAIWENIRPYFDSPVVAHNAHFDLSVLEQSFSQSHTLQQHFVDSIALARYMGLKKCNLAACAAFFEIDMGKHHNALDDALTCAQITLHVIKQFSCDSLWEFLALHRTIQIHPFPIGAPVWNRPPKPFSGFPKKRFETVRIHDITPTSAAISSTSPLFGCHIVFTGELSMDRKTAMQLAVDAGAVLKSTVTSKTSYLVVGKQDMSLVGESGKSSKERKAQELRDSRGSSITILDEASFRTLIQACSNCSDCEITRSPNG